MFLFDWLFPKKIIVYLDRQTLSVLVENKSVTTLNLSRQIVSTLDVIDPVLLEKTIFQFLSSQKLKGHVTVVLSDNLIFTGQIDANLMQDQEVVNKEFVFNVPFPAQNVATRFAMSKESGKVILMATNKSYFQWIVKSLLDFGLKVDAVVADMVLRRSIEEKQTPEFLFKAIKQNKNLVKSTNFLE